MKIISVAFRINSCKTIFHNGNINSKNPLKINFILIELKKVSFTTAFRSMWRIFMMPGHVTSVWCCHLLLLRELKQALWKPDIWSPTVLAFLMISQLTSVDHGLKKAKIYISKRKI